MYTVPPSPTLTESRLQLHYAIQLIAAAGAALAAPQADYSHTSLSWRSDLQTFVGALIPAPQPFRVALEPISLTAILLDDGGEELAHCPLDQKTLEDGLNWLKQAIASRGAEAQAVELLTYPPDDFPDHGIAHGAVFDASHPEARQALVTYYDDTEAVLDAIATQTPGASPIYIWPHHFDMATLVTLPAGPGGEIRTIGLGFSPGDTSYAEPYWYVTPYPYPDPSELPPLAANGFWHTQHWVGAVLPASQRAEEDGPTQLHAFFQSAYHASASLFH